MIHAVTSVNKVPLNSAWRFFYGWVYPSLIIGFYPERSVMDSLGYHLLMCKCHGSPVWEYDLIVSAWSACLKSGRTWTVMVDQIL